MHWQRFLKEFPSYPHWSDAEFAKEAYRTFTQPLSTKSKKTISKAQEIVSKRSRLVRLTLPKIKGASELPVPREYTACFDAILRHLEAMENAYTKAKERLNQMKHKVKNYHVDDAWKRQVAYQWWIIRTAGLYAIKFENWMYGLWKYIVQKHVA
jgi:hypothetical protein